MYHSTLKYVKDKQYTVIDVVSVISYQDSDMPEKEQLMALLDKKAEALNADGIIGITFSSSTWKKLKGENYPNMIVYGTAIKFED